VRNDKEIRQKGKGTKTPTFEGKGSQNDRKQKFLINDFLTL
jgi:hypothetical protein